MRVLVTIASRHGGTWGIGETMADVLRASGHEVTLRDPADVVSLEGVDAVVLGSAVYLAHWLPSARDLADRLAGELAERPVWLVSSGLATQPAAAANSPHEIRDLVERIGARGHRSFRGRLDRSVLSFAERSAIAGARTSREGDHRDMAAVTAFAREIGETLAPVSA